MGARICANISLPGNRSTSSTPNAANEHASAANAPNAGPTARSLTEPANPCGHQRTLTRRLALSGWAGIAEPNPCGTALTAT
ncbi:hypothetical protein B0I31_102181 [Saccharothrix carnea]|uniref:Uncharacterized protein n=1 Tax=Saccharothrix carnea TaxID=1280637 RepID=A0A2P8IFH5_SACCR|nr:hypothetical protein B0I31_102181 [Saccharothrix carnea]